MIIDTPKNLPSRNLLPLATTVERVYSEAPTWLVAVGLGILMAALVAVGNWRETQAADQECAALYGATNARCAK
jgi:hypothetical protein